MPEEGRDSTGRWLIFKELSESANTIINKQSKLAFDDED
jgi:hypothetical protein